MPLRMDPTRTTVLRQQFIAEMRRRFRTIRRAVIQLVVADDAFGLGSPSRLIVHAEKGVFRFRTNPQKVEAFRNWLEEAVKGPHAPLSVDATGRPWTAKYVDSAYRKGTIHAFEDARGPELLSPAQGYFEGTKAEFLRAAFSQPERLAKVELLYTRAFEELRGVSAAMAQQLNRELASGLANGLGAREIARGMAKRIDGLTRTRAEVIARTEIIHAHAEGQLDSFKDLGVEELGILAEWSTAGDQRVCARCADREGEVFKVDDAHGMIPLHPNCRCSWIPTTLEEQRERRERLLKEAGL